MNMFAAVASPSIGTISEICIKIGESVESKDLLVRQVK
jgi:pyruvate carboxylase